MEIALLHAFPLFSPGISDLMTFVRFLDFPGPAEGPASRNRSGHVLPAPSLWSQWIARTSRWSRQYASTSIPKSCRLQCTSPSDSPRKSIWDPIGHIHPPPFRFLGFQRGSRETKWSRQYVSTSIPVGRLSDSSPYQCARSTARAKADVKLQSISKGRGGGNSSTSEAI